MLPQLYIGRRGHSSPGYPRSLYFCVRLPRPHKSLPRDSQVSRQVVREQIVQETRTRPGTSTGEPGRETLEWQSQCPPEPTSRPLCARRRVTPDLFRRTGTGVKSGSGVTWEGSQSVLRTQDLRRPLRDDEVRGLREGRQDQGGVETFVEFTFGTRTCLRGIPDPLGTHDGLEKVSREGGWSTFPYLHTFVAPRRVHLRSWSRWTSLLGSRTRAVPPRTWVDLRTAELPSGVSDVDGRTVSPTDSDKERSNCRFRHRHDDG